EHFKARHVRQSKVEYGAVIFARGEGIERGLARIHSFDIDVLVTEKLANRHLFGDVVFDDQKALAARLRVIPDAGEGSVEGVRTGGLGDERERAAGEAVVAILIERQHLD